MDTGVIIGISGHFGTGKTTASTIISNALNGSMRPAQAMGFADELKSDVHKMLAAQMGGLFTDILNTDRIEELKPDCLGPMYQGYGELARQLFGQDYWIRRLVTIYNKDIHTIIHDVRHVNEAQWIQSKQGIIIAIDGPNRRSNDQRSLEHASERHIDDIARVANYRIRNFTGLEAFERKLLGIIGEIFIGRPFDKQRS